ncbi:MBL fold metallo-hydrolase [Nibrella saemangeumensis]|uniref:MBL fold metallo-hydrolase n=1 Tax=Nibrella saemangeumensis TaxID=1084526 RepID=A0ABP8N2E9_9BACT
MDVLVLDVTFTHNDYEDTLHPVILRGYGETLLVDCGYAGFGPLIEEAASKHGLSLADLTGIIISHHDIDHVGGLHEIKEQFPAVNVYASEIDAPYITGKLKSARLRQAEEMFPSLPEEHKAGALSFLELLKTVQPVAVDSTFATDEKPAYWPGVQIINTPGHMPGHISIYLKDSRTLVACDAVVVENGAFEIANPQFTLDLEQALASVKKLQTLDITRVVCYHGGVVEGDVPQKLGELVARYR